MPALTSVFLDVAGKIRDVKYDPETSFSQLVSRKKSYLPKLWCVRWNCRSPNRLVDSIARRLFALTVLNILDAIGSYRSGAICYDYRYNHNIFYTSIKKYAERVEFFLPDYLKVKFRDLPVFGSEINWTTDL